MNPEYAGIYATFGPSGECPRCEEQDAEKSNDIIFKDWECVVRNECLSCGYTWTETFLLNFKEELVI